MGVSNKTAIVTGAGSGIGAGIAAKLAKHGANLVVCDLNGDSAKSVAEKINTAGGRAIAVSADVTNWEEVSAMAEETVHVFGSVDILVNNAGALKDNSILRMPLEDWELVINTCLKGAWLCCKAVLGHMRAQGFGRVVNIASRAWLGNPGQSNYSSAKAGVVGLTSSLALEFASHGVTVNSVAPGFIEAPMARRLPPETQEKVINAQPIKRPGRIEDVANAVLFFCDEETSYVTGQILYVDGGRHVA
ncbi:MAG: 3-oxoacyl-(acyl-carrier-protein) reductase FabG [Pelotomaculum sp. PtaB.Bin013]|uniref:3-oxoacyl-ACP reductase FabG n=1 Tax=Pelotomaculum isophthalicicum JI TaxID=947010 RepID=A0A9X4H499_9FIRM|nr:3-oxoacyl-ACP reductase FabG [Pelotomaculum isophthalicicum]MDF9407457.1 3-oxoacyl-ACP reductase FabG [Pelotomaculum isophthalicicum JI]OPX89377.1 MAG: 3-oxoacyl-(acyl-carrier-protein) reductase FabG [Pelotomaculum sp. PtaB.Bin013]